MLARFVTDLAASEVRLFAARAKRMAALYAALGLFAFLTAGFLFVALFGALAERYGAVDTAMGFAAGCFVLAVAAYMLIAAKRRKPRRRVNERLERDLAAIADVTALSGARLARSLKLPRRFLVLPIVGAAAWGGYLALSAARRRNERSVRRRNRFRR